MKVILQSAGPRFTQEELLFLCLMMGHETILKSKDGFYEQCEVDYKPLIKAIIWDVKHSPNFPNSPNQAYLVILERCIDKLIAAEILK